MSDYMPKFYTLEDMTQEDLNKLALERNTYIKEIERLTELCNKYEEEHKTTFETWQRDIKENELLHFIIKEAREYIVGYIISDEDAKRDLRLGVSYSIEVGSDELGKLLEILDKAGESNVKD